MRICVTVAITFIDNQMHQNLMHSAGRLVAWARLRMPCLAELYNIIYVPVVRIHALSCWYCIGIVIVIYKYVYYCCC